MKYSCDYCNAKFDTEAECLEHEDSHKPHKFFKAYEYIDRGGSDRIGVTIKDTTESICVKDPHVIRKYCDLEIHFKDDDAQKAFDLMFDTVMCELTDDVENVRSRLDSFLAAMRKIYEQFGMTNYMEYLQNRRPYSSLAELLRFQTDGEEEKCE